MRTRSTLGTAHLITPASGRDLAARRALVFASTTHIQLPEDLGATSDVVLQTIVDQALSALKSLAGLDNPSDDDVAEGERLANVLRLGKGELATRGEAASARKGKLGDLISGVETASEEAESAAVEETESAGAELAETAVETEAVVASGNVRAGAVKGAGGGSAAPNRRDKIALVAAPDAPGVPQGHTYGDFLEAAQGIVARTSGYPSGPIPGSARYQHGALRLRRHFEDALIASALDATEVMEYATSLDRVGGAAQFLGSSLTAAAGGGWASPSETLYDLVELEASDGMIDVPEIQVQRGGVRFTRGPLFADLRGHDFAQTEAQAIAGTAIPFYTIPAPDFVEERAGVTGLGVTVPILQNRAYPESVARVLRGLTVAHAHKVNNATIADMVADSTAVTAPAGAGAFNLLLSAIELQAVDIRYRHSMDDNTVLELVLPQWAIPLLRQDLANRNEWNLERIPDSAVIEHFIDRKVRPQFVKDWQDSALGLVTPATAWPATIKALLYPAGTWVRGLGDVINVETVYDSAGLSQNQYTGLFTEESYLTTRFGQESRVLTVPVTADGSNPSVRLTKTVA